MASKISEWLFGKKSLTNTYLGGQRWIPIGNQIIQAPTDSLEFIEKGYETNDIVYAIINLICDKATVAPWGVYKVVDESSLKSYKAIQHEIVNTKGNVASLRKQALEFRSKALELTTNSRLNALLDYPNENQSWSELLREELMYKLITGNKFLAATFLDSGANTGKPGSLFCLPSQGVTIISNGMFPASPQEYRLLLGQLINFTKEEVLHEKYPSINFKTLNNLYGMSPLQAASMLITRTNEGTKAGATAFKNMGQSGFVFLDDPEARMDMGVDQMAKMKSDFYRNYNHPDNKGSLGFVNAKLGLVKTNNTPVELGVIESEKWDVTRLCSVYGVPPVLLMPDNSTYNNIEHAEKALTTRAVLPHLISKRDSFNHKLQTDWGYKGENVMIDFDMDVYHELRQDVGEQVKYLAEAWWFTLRMKYEAMEMEIPPSLSDEELDRVYALRGTIPLSDIGLDAQMNVADQALNKAGIDY